MTLAPPAIPSAPTRSPTAPSPRHRTESRRLSRLYRPGEPFSAEELQTLSGDGALRHLLGDVYSPRSLPLNPQIRAEAVAALLTPADRADVVVCGETAGWVLLGAPPPRRLTLICSGFRRRRRTEVLARQSHEVALAREDAAPLAGLRVTTPARTVADVVLGIGTEDSSGPLEPEHTDARRVELAAALLSVFTEQAAPKRVEDVIALQLTRRGDTVDRPRIAALLGWCLDRAG